MKFSEARLQAESSTCIYSRAGITCVDAPRVRRRVPLVDRRVVLHARIGALPRGLGDLAHELARGNRIADRLAGHARDEVPVLVVLDGLHERVGQAHRVVGVLVLDRDEALTVDRHVEAGIAQRVGLLLLLGLAPDELADVRVVDVEHDHLRRAARLAAGLDRARPGVGAAHEGDRAGRGAALGQRLHRAADVREVDARARAAEEDLALACVFQSRIDSIVSSTERMKQAEHCGLSSKPTLNQTGELNAAIWCSSTYVSSAWKASPSSTVAKYPRERPQSAIVPATRPIIWRTECSRVGESSWPRKYFWATMFVAFCDHVCGNSTPRCSKATRSPWAMRASRSSHSTVANGSTRPS